MQKLDIANVSVSVVFYIAVLFMLLLTGCSQQVGPIPPGDPLCGPCGSSREYREFPTCQCRCRTDLCSTGQYADSQDHCACKAKSQGWSPPPGPIVNISLACACQKGSSVEGFAVICFDGWESISPGQQLAVTGRLVGSDPEEACTNACQDGTELLGATFITVTDRSCTPYANTFEFSVVGTPISLPTPRPAADPRQAQSAQQSPTVVTLAPGETEADRVTLSAKLPAKAEVPASNNLDCEQECLGSHLSPHCIHTNLDKDQSAGLKKVTSVLADPKIVVATDPQYRDWFHIPDHLCVGRGDIVYDRSLGTLTNDGTACGLSGELVANEVSDPSISVKFPAHLGATIHQDKGRAEIRLNDGSMPQLSFGDASMDAFFGGNINQVILHSDSTLVRTQHSCIELKY